MSASFITWAADLQPFEKKKKNSPTLLMIICDLEKGAKLSLKKKKNWCPSSNGLWQSLYKRKGKFKYLECFLIYKQSRQCKYKTKPKKSPEGALEREWKVRFPTSALSPHTHTHLAMNCIIQAEQYHKLPLDCMLLFGVSCPVCLDWIIAQIWTWGEVRTRG